MSTLYSMFIIDFAKQSDAPLNNYFVSIPRLNVIKNTTVLWP